MSNRESATSVPISKRPSSSCSGPAVVLVGNDLNTLLTAYYLLWPNALSQSSKPLSAGGASSVTVLSSNRRLNFHWADQSVFSYWSTLMNDCRLSSKLLSHHVAKLTPSNAKFLYHVNSFAAFKQRYALMKLSFDNLCAMQQNSLFPYLKSALTQSKSATSEPLHHIFTDKVHALRELDGERQQFKQGTGSELVLLQDKELDSAPELKAHSYLFSAIGRTQNDIVLPTTFANTLLAQCQQKKFDVILNAQVKGLEWCAVQPASPNSPHAGAQSNAAPHYHVNALHTTQGTFKADTFVVQDSEAMLRLFGVPNRHLLVQRIVGMNVAKPNMAVRPVHFHHEALFLIPDQQRMAVSMVRHYYTPEDLLATPAPQHSYSSVSSSSSSSSSSPSASALPSLSSLFGQASRSFVPTSDVRRADMYDAKHLIEGGHLLYKDFQPNTLASSDVNVRWEAVVDDLMPIVGAVKPYDNVYVNTGHAFFGAAAFPACARWTAQMILGGTQYDESEQHTIAAVSPDRINFPRTPPMLTKESAPIIIETKH